MLLPIHLRQLAHRLLHQPDTFSHRPRGSQYLSVEESRRHLVHKARRRTVGIKRGSLPEQFRGKTRVRPAVGFAGSRELQFDSRTPADVNPCPVARPSGNLLRLAVVEEGRVPPVQFRESQRTEAAKVAQQETVRRQGTLQRVGSRLERLVVEAE